jgi:hypothetical protein
VRRCYLYAPRTRIIIELKCKLFGETTCSCKRTGQEVSRISTKSLLERTASVVVEFLATYLEVRVRFPAPPDFLRSSGSGTGSTQPREYN